MKLSEQQELIVNADDRFYYVLAGAGSGKTRTLTEKVKVSIQNRKNSEKVIAITFSNKAANELKERLLLEYSEEELREYAFVGTIHNFCMELISNKGVHIGIFTNPVIFEKQDDRLKIFINALAFVPNIRKRCFKDGSLDNKLVYDEMNRISQLKRDLVFPDDKSLTSDTRILYLKYNELLLEQNSIDFDDILLLAYRIMSENDEVAEIYHRIYTSIFVDEAQDLNKSQYEFIKTLVGPDVKLFMVGDPIQSIYGFNGSSSRYMCGDFPVEFGAKEYVLSENYRSARSIIDAAKRLDPNFKIECQIDSNGVFEVQPLSDEILEASWIVDKIIELNVKGIESLHNEPIPLENIAILARNKYIFGILEANLNERGVVYYIKSVSATGFSSESKIFRIFELGLLLISNKSDKIHLDEIVEKLRIIDNSPESFNDLMQKDYLMKYLDPEEAILLNNSWKDIVENDVSHLTRILNEFENYYRKLSTGNKSEELKKLIADLKIWRDRWEIFTRSTSIEDRNLGRLIREISLGTLYKDESSGVTLSTVHMSKGLEFDVVFIMGVVDGVFPDYRSTNDESKLDEEKHCMFVSITRAKKICYVTYPLTRVLPWGETKRTKKSRFLD